VARDQILESLVRRIDQEAGDFLRSGTVTLDEIIDGSKYARVLRQYISDGGVIGLLSPRTGRIIPADDLEWLGEFGSGLDGDLAPTASMSLPAETGVYEFASVNIPTGVTLTVPAFCVILCTGDFILSGNITVTPFGQVTTSEGQPGFGISAGRGGVWTPNQGFDRGVWTGGGGGGYGGAGGSGGLTSNQSATIPIGLLVPGASGGGGAGAGSGPLAPDASKGLVAGRGGRGGGLLIIKARGVIEISGTITNFGQNAVAGTFFTVSLAHSTYGAGGGGGGSGGGVYMYSSQGVIVPGTIDVHGGNGSAGIGLTGYSNYTSGGGGGGGIVTAVAPRVEITGTVTLTGGSAGPESGGAGVGTAGGSGVLKIIERSLTKFDTRVPL